MLYSFDAGWKKMESSTRWRNPREIGQEITDLVDVENAFNIKFLGYIDINNCMYTWDCEWVRPIFSVTSRTRHIAFPSWEFAHDQCDNSRWIFQQLENNSICFEKSPQFLRIFWSFSSTSSQLQIAGFEYLDFHSYKACINIWHFLSDPVACIVPWEIVTMENTTFSSTLHLNFLSLSLSFSLDVSFG